MEYEILYSSGADDKKKLNTQTKEDRKKYDDDDTGNAIFFNRILFLYL